MIKFFKNNSKYFYIVGSFILVLMIAGMGVLIGSQFVNKTKAANTYTLIVEKTSTVSIYVSGKGVTPDYERSDDNNNVYLVEQGTSVSLRAVNESRMFVSWVISGEYSALTIANTSNTVTDQRFDIKPTGNLTISTEKRNAKTSDYGNYMTSKFTLSLELHLMYLQSIFNAGNNVNSIKEKEVLDAYDYFFNKYSTYEENVYFLSNTDSTEASTKAQRIVDGNYFTKIQNGYFNVTSSFSLLNDNFVGIGSYDRPFNGVLCGNVNGIESTVFVTASNTETSGEDMYRGFFQVTGRDAVIRNINIRTSFGIKEASTAASNIYVGGIAGYVNNSVLSEVDVLARIAVDSAGANIHAGGIAGRFEGGLDKGRNILLNGKDTTFILTTKAEQKNIHAGLVTGEATNVYVKEANVETTNFAISAKNTASNTYSDNTNIYLGNLFGKFTATEAMPIEEVNIHGTSKESITALISSGNSYIGGLIGHLTVSSASVELGDVSITNTSGESILSGSSVDKDSRANIITAGLIACVVGNNLNAKEEFLDGVTTKVVDGVTHYAYEYIFNTDLLIQSINNGLANGSTFGKTMATGFIARGYMNLNGTSNTIRNEIFLSSGEYQTKVYATQTSTSKHTEVDLTNGTINSNTNDKEHCLATAFYGNINTTGTIQNINVYASNYDIAATRELGSFGMGDVHAAGFVAYTSGVNLTNITMHLNDSYIKGHSLSYEVENQNTDTNSGVNSGGINNCYVGGFIGTFDGTSTDEDYLVNLTNITFAGNYDHATGVTSGTTSKVEGIQNTIGAGDYNNENYVGGIIGRMHYACADSLTYLGSNSDKDAIISLTHENPASAFCGGAIGYIKNNENLAISINNVEVSNALIYAGATVTDNNNGWPDIYVGGVLGAIYHDTSNSGRSIEISNAIVSNTDISADGNEVIMLYIGGILGTSTWSGSATINDSYVIDCSFDANVYVNTDIDGIYKDDDWNPVKWFNLECYAAGIMGRTNSATFINNCAVIDTNISTSYKNNINTTACNTESCGIFGDDEGKDIYITNTYSNATLSSTGSCYGISNSANSTTSAYYVQQNAVGTSGVGVALDFSNKLVEKSNTLLFPLGETTPSLPSTAVKYYIALDNTDDFTTGVTSNNIGVYANSTVENASSFADIWINAKEAGDAEKKNPFSYSTEADRIKAGWFNLGSLVCYYGNAGTSATISSTEYSLVDDISEYKYQKNESDVWIFKNINYPYNTISTDEDEYLIQSTNAEGSLANVSIINVIDVRIVSNMRQFKISLNVSATEYYPALFDKDGNLINTNGLNYDEYGTFDYVINGTNYVITYQPNESINHDDTFYIGFVNAKGNVLTNGCYQFNISHNATELIGVIYADYTKPLNYQDITFSNTNINDPNNVIYKLRPNKIIKILPVFQKSNEKGTYIISELNVSKVSYSSSAGIMKSNGELTAPDSGEEGTVTVTYTEGDTTQTFTIKFEVVSEVTVSYSSVGADVDALTFATTDNDYYMGIDLLEHYGGAPIKFDVKYQGNVNEHIFESPKLPDNTETLTLTLGGAAGTITLQASKDDGDTWEKVEDITVETTYIDYDINFNFIGYTNFRLVNTTNYQIGISAYKVFVKNLTSTVKADIQNSKLGGNTVVDTSGNHMFTMTTNAKVTRDEIHTTGTGINGIDYSNSEVTFDSFEATSTNYINGDRYTSVTVVYQGTATVSLYGKYATSTSTQNSPADNRWTIQDYVQIDILNSGEPETNMKNTNYSRWSGTNYSRLVAIKIVVTDASDDFAIEAISYNRGEYNNDYYNENVTVDKTKLDYSKIEYITYINVKGNATFTFNDPLDSISYTLDDGSIINEDIQDNTSVYNLSGTDLKITSLSVVVTKDTTLTYTFDSANTTNQTATFSSSAGGTVKGYINGCTESDNNLLLYGTGFIIKDKNAVIAKGWIKDENGNPLTSWDIEDTYYQLFLSKDFIADDDIPDGTTIYIDIEFPIVYTVSFDLQSESFNPDNTGETFITFKVEAGTTFNQMFGDTVDPSDNTRRIGTAVNSAKLFGFVFGGFYLIDTGNTLAAYSMSFGDLLDQQGDTQIYSSYMYYARWSFKIEHIEAPGTIITPSFEAGFLEDLNPEDYEDLNAVLTIPINNNRGYVFTVEKEEGFIGEAQVNAYIVDDSEHFDFDGDKICDSCGNPVSKTGHVREIEIEKYHDNMYLYYIPPEAITGYLVIVSNVTNSSIIVGKNTASVTEQILPKDGVYTFKYVVNHKAGESYIYDDTAGLLEVKKNILIEFKQQTYNGTVTEVKDRTLPAGTTIEAYYTLYRNSNITEQAIGVYTAIGDETKVTLDKFTQWNQSVEAFNTTKTFGEFLGSDDTVSEVFYFVVTPPNGYNPGFDEKGNEIINEIIYVGYCNNDQTSYLEGSRNDQGLTNIPLEGIIGEAVAKESSKQEKIYSVTPSRQTDLNKNNDGSYTFKDIDTYHIVDLIVTNGSEIDSKVVLSDNSTNNNTIVTSSEINGYIRELGLKLGYNTGLIKVSGSTDGSSWETIASFTVDSFEYTYYYVDFEAKAKETGYNYKYFKVDNASLNDIRLEAFSYSTISNAMLYEFDIASGVSTTVDNVTTYNFTNEIVGDTRHDGKTFMLEVELNNETIPANSITITVNGSTEVTPLLSEREGKIRAYFNLSELLTDDVRTIKFTINNSSDYTIKAVRLLEVSTAQKPAVSEIREEIA